MSFDALGATIWQGQAAGLNWTVRLKPVDRGDRDQGAAIAIEFVGSDSTYAEAWWHPKEQTISGIPLGAWPKSAVSGLKRALVGFDPR